MQKSIFQKTTGMIILVLLLTICFCFLSKMGIGPLWAAIGIIFVKGCIRFVFRMTVLLVSIAIVIALIVFLICLICI